MSYSTVLTELDRRIGTVAGIAVVLDYEPTVIQTTPTCYSLLDSVKRSYGGNVVTLTYRVLHRLCLQWVETEQAEQEVIPFVNSVPKALDSSGIRAGDVIVTNIDAGWMSIGETLYRTLDFYSETIEYAGLGNG